jgi:lipopolysaccharide/colanic/teichoic acid biosynthesis glycosyltransferase
VTRVGRFLRKTKLDELPQLINVLLGEMSLVGPRPEDPRYVALYSSEQRRVLNVKPGMTSPASLHFRDESSLLEGNDWEQLYVHEILPKKLEIDIDYVRRATVMDDIGVILRTIGAVLNIKVHNISRCM